MTRKENIDVTCPHCGSPGKHEHYGTANVTLNPELKQRVLDGSLFTFTCDNCGQSTFVQGSCLYHDIDNRLLVHFSPGASDASGLKGILDSLSGSGLRLSFQDDGYEVRDVPDLASLKEKISIADDGLDDRLVEIIKVLTEVLVSQEADPVDYDDVRYLGIDADGIEIGFLRDGQIEAGATMPMSIYEDQKQKHPYDSRTGDDYFINDEWAWKESGLVEEDG